MQYLKWNNWLRAYFFKKFDENTSFSPIYVLDMEDTRRLYIPDQAFLVLPSYFFFLVPFCTLEKESLICKCVKLMKADGTLY